MTNKFDSLGDRCKAEEHAWSVVLDSSKPIVMRLDGRAFHTLTRNFSRPFDGGFRGAMVDAAKELTKELRPEFAYTQSDEITLIFKAVEPKKVVKGLSRCMSEVVEERVSPFFGGKIQKLTSVSASIATSAFNRSLNKNPGMEELSGHFDSRVYNVETWDDALRHVHWRQKDCIKNSVAMVAKSQFSHKTLHGKHQDDQLAMLLEVGVDWHSFEGWQKFGTFTFRKTMDVELSLEELSKIPERFQPENGMAKRTKILETSTMLKDFLADQ